MTSETVLLARCARMGSSTWSDAIDSLGIAGVVQGLAHRSGEGVMAGFATTVRHTCGSLGRFDRADFAAGELVAAVGPGRVLVVDMGGAGISTFGGLAAFAAKQRQTPGGGIDGGGRGLGEVPGTGPLPRERVGTPRPGQT